MWEKTSELILRYWKNSVLQKEHELLDILYVCLIVLTSLCFFGLLFLLFFPLFLLFSTVVTLASEARAQLPEAGENDSGHLSVLLNTMLVEKLNQENLTSITNH